MKVIRQMIDFGVHQGQPLGQIGKLSSVSFHLGEHLGDVRGRGRGSRRSRSIDDPEDNIQLPFQTIEI